jgi:lipopolysaccharide heptosyltransferase I
MSGPDARLTQGDRLLILRLGAVGDVIRTLPALHLIRRAAPGVFIAWLVEDLSRDLLAGHPEIDEVIRFPRRELLEAAVRPARIPGLLRDLARGLRGRRFTVAADFQGSLKSGLAARLSGARRRVGFAPGHAREMSFLFTNVWVRPGPAALNRVARNLLLAEALGASGDEVEIVLPERPDEARRAEVILRELSCGTPIVLSPGTSHRQRRKAWPPEHYARLAALLRRDFGAAPLVAWGPGEEETARGIVAASAGAARALPPTGLRLLAALLRRAALFVGADTGPMHLAWGVGCPVVALFGPTDPRLNGPLGPDHAVLRRGPRTALIAPEEVLAAARRALQRRGGDLRIAPRLSRAAVFRTAADAAR